MNVLVVSHTYISPINRDKWKTLAQLYPKIHLTVIIPQRWPTVLFNHAITTEELNKENTDNLTFLALNTFFSGNEVRYCYYPLQLYQAIKTCRPQVIHVEQGESALSYSQCIITAKLLGFRPKFIFFTWINWLPRQTLSHRIFWKHLQQYNLANSHGALTGNIHAKELLEAKGCKKPITVLAQLGINQNIFFPRIERKNLDPGLRRGDCREITATFTNELHSMSYRRRLVSTPLDTCKIKNNIPKTIIFIGRLVPEKGIFLLLDAFTQLTHHHNQWCLTFIGDGTAKQHLLERIKNSSPLAIKHIATQSHHEIAKALTSSDILVVPSYDTATWKEQFGHVIVEAMACGVPVIASTGGAIPEVIGNAGLLCKQNNSADLAQSLDQLMSDELLRKTYATRGLERVNKEYTHEAIAHSTYRFWHKMVTSL